jgi:hypothetical protein
LSQERITDILLFILISVPKTENKETAQGPQSSSEHVEDYDAVTCAKNVSGTISRRLAGQLVSSPFSLAALSPIVPPPALAVFNLIVLL